MIQALVTVAAVSVLAVIPFSVAFGFAVIVRRWN